MATKSKEFAEKEKRREITIKETLTSKDFYNLKPILDLNPDISVIWGQRSNGKTYQVLLYALKNYKKSKRTFVYVRRWAEDIVVKSMTKLMSPLPVEDIFGKGYAIKFFRGAFILYNDEDDEVEEQTLGWAVALNQVAHTKSQTFDKAQVIILDEFLQLKSERVLRDEFDAWEQTLSTIIRTQQDMKIFIIGNSICKYSPYFSPYGIDPNAITQGEIKEILLTNEEGEPTKVCAEWCKYNPKIGKRTSKYVRGSKMAQTGEWEIQDVANIPHTDNEVAYEQMLCSMFDPVMGINLGMFVRYAKWYTLELKDGLYQDQPHEREFLVIRQTPNKSSYYHLTNVKDLTYTSWNNVVLMWKDIKERIGIDIENELQMGRVYCEDSFTGDYFYHTYLNYLRVDTRDLL